MGNSEVWGKVVVFLIVAFVCYASCEILVPQMIKLMTAVNRKIGKNLNVGILLSMYLIFMGVVPDLNLGNGYINLFSIVILILALLALSAGE